MNLEKIIKDENPVIIDVRTPGEFMSGSVSGAINIPLNNIQDTIPELREKNSPIIVCCASGMRSFQAQSILQNAGITNVHNGGSWFDVNYLVNNK